MSRVTSGVWNWQWAKKPGGTGERPQCENHFILFKLILAKREPDISTENNEASISSITSFKSWLKFFLFIHLFYAHVFNKYYMSSLFAMGYDLLFCHFYENKCDLNLLTYLSSWQRVYFPLISFWIRNKLPKFHESFSEFCHVYLLLLFTYLFLLDIWDSLFCMFLTMHYSKVVSWLHYRFVCENPIPRSRGKCVTQREWISMFHPPVFWTAFSGPN